jgi:hypothetical protein
LQRLPSRSFAAILDVGAGPATNIGTFAPGKAVEVVAVDPLAHVYDHIIANAATATGRAGPPIRSQFAFAEDLSSRFAANTFDVVTCTNALDHAIEPAWGILEMLMVTREGGKIYLGHTQNEAVRENYCGFHQWNFDVEDSRFIIWNASRRIDATELFADFADVRATMPVENWVKVDIVKREAPPFDMQDYHRRLRALLLEAMLLGTPEMQALVATSATSPAAAPVQTPSPLVAS